MSIHRFRIVNVFTYRRGALTGNPLCVFEDGAELDSTTMQALARQFNLSETTFILPSTRADARVRIFTPTYEMPFAGHPTLGTAHVCRALKLGTDALRLEMQAGIIPVTASGDRWTLTALEPTWREVEEPRGVLAEALGLESADIGERPLWIKSGKEQLVVPLATEDAVRRAQPQFARLSAIRSEDGISMAYLFTERNHAGGRGADSGKRRTLARFFFPQNGSMTEDPATGSATANFGGWCLAAGWPLPLEVEISQGEQIARPSTLHLHVDAGRQIRVGGDVIELGRGALHLE
jgi:PhzF family phenazine biosynthesis protein